MDACLLHYYNKHAPGVTFNSHPQSTPDSSALTRTLAALSSPLALSLSLLDLNNSLRARSVRPSLPLDVAASSAEVPSLPQPRMVGTQSS